MPNMSPALGGFAPAVTFIENDINAAPALIDADVDLTDLEDNFNGGTVTVSRLLADDVVAIRHQGAGAGQIGVAGTNVTYGGTIVGSFAGGVGATLTVTFNAAATAASVDALIQNLTFASADDTPVASHKLVLNVTDADGATLGPAAVPATFAELTGAANPLGFVDTDLLAKPTFVDLDGDGDLDAVAGGFDGKLRLFDNDDGTFTELTGGANPLDGVQLDDSSPGFVDLDGDGDLDLVVGDYDGTLHAFENEVGLFTELTGTDNPFNGVDVGGNATVAVVDLDDDSDLDVVVGNYEGYLQSFENDGGAFTELTGAADPFDGLYIGRRSAPGFVDLDGDGDPDLVTGIIYGAVRSFENQDGVFTELTGAANPFDGFSVYDGAAAFADLDGDGDLDAVIGDFYGLLHTFENLTPRGQAISVNITASDDAAVAKDDAFSTDEATAIIAGNLFADNGSGVDVDVDGPFTVAAVNGSAGNVGVPILLASGASLTVEADGTYTYDPNHAFDALAAAGSGAVNISTTDSFTYTLTNGNTAAVTIAINGVDSDDQLLGTAAADVLAGGIGDDELLGGLGADRMIGGQGGDTYHFDNVGDRAVEKAGNGLDTIYSSIGLAVDAGVENVTLTGVAAINATGNGLDNLMIGNSAANELNGFTGADDMRGGDGDDLYTVDNAGDVVVEELNEGTDTIISKNSLTLGANVENLILSGTASIGTGNGLANILIGNALGNTLNGAGGADEMRGGAGNDLYFVDDAGDVVVEGSGNGTDTVSSSVTFSLGAYVENLTLTGSANVNATGNGQANVLIGNSGNNMLDGGAGADEMRGGAGDDSYVVDHAGDVVVEGGNNGTDTVTSSVSFTLGASVENLVLTGGSAIHGTGNNAANVITGNGAANTLSGGAGADTLIGGGGADNLHGGTGHDDLTGGAGADRFRFDTALSAANNVDDILDFIVADDTLYLDRDIFAGIAANGTLAASAFRAGTSALDGDDRMLYDSATGQIRYDADGIGGVGAVLFATVTPGLALTNADFVGYV